MLAPSCTTFTIAHALPGIVDCRGTTTLDGVAENAAAQTGKASMTQQEAGDRSWCKVTVLDHKAPTMMMTVQVCRATDVRQSRVGLAQPSPACRPCQQNWNSHSRLPR